VTLPHGIRPLPPLHHTTTFVLLLLATSPFHFMIHFHFIWPTMVPTNGAILLLYLVTLDW